MFELKGATKTAFLVFFISHIPISLLLDSQAVLPSFFHPTPIQNLLKLYATTFKDEMMTPPYPLFLQVFVTCELLFQIPFFIVATYALLKSSDNVISGSGWFRTACLIYGSHTATTLFPILATFVMNENLVFTEKCLLFGFYLPYLIFPVWLVVIAAVSENVFGEAEEKSPEKSN